MNSKLHFPTVWNRYYRLMPVFSSNPANHHPGKPWGNQAYANPSPSQTLTLLCPLVLPCQETQGLWEGIHFKTCLTSVWVTFYQRSCCWTLLNSRTPELHGWERSSQLQQGKGSKHFSAWPTDLGLCKERWHLPWQKKALLQPQRCLIPHKAIEFSQPNLSQHTAVHPQHTTIHI